VSVPTLTSAPTEATLAVPMLHAPTPAVDSSALATTDSPVMVHPVSMSTSVPTVIAIAMPMPFV
jgi:hypothetical protein